VSEADVQAQIVSWLGSGIAVPEVERRLRESGVGPKEASQLVDAALTKQVSDAAIRQRWKDCVALIGGTALCILGALFLVGGILGLSQPGYGLFAAGGAAISGGLTLIIRATV
jgi:hypothetical protein